MTGINGKSPRMCGTRSVHRKFTQASVTGSRYFASTAPAYAVVKKRRMLADLALRIYIDTQAFFVSLNWSFMAHEQVAIDTADGSCPAHVIIPQGAGPWPAVIIYMDALGMRPVLVEIAERLAQNGYLALLPDLFYRAGAYRVPTPKEVFAGGDAMTIIGPLMGDYRSWQSGRGHALLPRLSRQPVRHGGKSGGSRLLYGRRDGNRRGRDLSRPDQGRRQLSWRAIGYGRTG